MKRIMYVIVKILVVIVFCNPIGNSIPNIVQVVLFGIWFALFISDGRNLYNAFKVSFLGFLILIFFMLKTLVGGI